MGTSMEGQQPCRLFFAQGEGVYSCVGVCVCVCTVEIFPHIPYIEVAKTWKKRKEVTVWERMGAGGIRDILGQSLGDTSLISLHWPEFTVRVFYQLSSVTFSTWQVG